MTKYVSPVSGSMITPPSVAGSSGHAGSLSIPPGPPGLPGSSEEDWFQNVFRPHFEKWVCGPIDRLVVSDDALVGFIFMSCATDYLASLWLGQSTKGQVEKAYTGFIAEYFIPNPYSVTDLYQSLRNGLVHLFTIKGGKYSLTHNHPELHLSIDRYGQTVLDAGEFKVDLFNAKDRYFDQVRHDPTLLGKALDRLRRDGFMHLALL